jgi:hypothetical protein
MEYPRPAALRFGHGSFHGLRSDSGKATGSIIPVLFALTSSANEIEMHGDPTLTKTHAHAEALTMADLSIAELCQHWRQTYGEAAPSSWTVRNGITEGRIPARKVGSQWRVHADDLERARVNMHLPARGRAA